MIILIEARGKPKAPCCYVWQRELVFDQISKFCTQWVFENIKNESTSHNDSIQPERLYTVNRNSEKFWYWKESVLSEVHF